jgi:hypothetical protein
MIPFLRERNIQMQKIRILTADLGLIDVKQVVTIIFPMVV